MTYKPIPKAVLSLEQVLSKPFSLVLCLDKFNAYLETQGDTKAEFDLNVVQWWEKEKESLKRSDFRLFVFLNEQIKEISADYINQVQSNLKKHRIKNPKIKNPKIKNPESKNPKSKILNSKNQTKTKKLSNTLTPKKQNHTKQTNL